MSKLEFPKSVLRRVAEEAMYDATLAFSDAKRELDRGDRAAAAVHADVLAKIKLAETLARKAR